MKDSVQWSRLDNAAKIFPPTSNNKETWVFRIACELFEPVTPGILQTALDRTMKQFPFYSSVIKKGLFWYYFENSGLKPYIKEESNPPCSMLYDSGQKNLLFEVTYYGKRINLEVYHALSDGTGALQFLRTLVFYYITEKHKEVIGEELVLTDYDASLEDKEQDSFSKYYTTEKVTPLPKQSKAHQLRGECFPNDRMGIVEGKVPVKALLAKAREYHTTVSEFLTAVLICSIHDSMNLREEIKPIVVAVPVNLRNYFPSGSAKNFFGVANVGHCFKTQGSSFEEVLDNVKNTYKHMVTEEQMRSRLNALYSVEDNIFARLVPLALKDTGLKIAAWLSGKENTASFSNIGRITMPSEIAPFINMFVFFTSTKHLQICLCSFNDTMCISFTSRYKSASVQRGFFKRLTSLGVTVEISTNTTERQKEEQ